MRRLSAKTKAASPGSPSSCRGSTGAASSKVTRASTSARGASKAVLPEGLDAIVVMRVSCAEASAVRRRSLTATVEVIFRAE